MSNKKNNKGQLIIIIALGCCVLALLGAAIALALSGGESKPKDSTPDNEWTQNY